MIKTLFLGFVLIFITTSTFAKCNFKTGSYIEDLKDPSKIKLIKIEINKNKKYVKNFLQIALSNGNHISPNLRKKFNALVKVHYNFGICEYTSRLRQSGDMKDHINFVAGKPIRSLDVKLRDGNILGSVHFKLLIPETRGGINEVLATLILKKLGFISPETFEVETSINGVKAKMLFQENAKKELLEKNLRRENPIFEGDEELLFFYRNFKNLELEPLALSRMTNKKWFLKGSSSQKISLEAHSKLQKSYLEYVTAIDEKIGLIISPNRFETDTFANYFFTLLAMHGQHGLRPNNRKYYFNSISSEFEPIYYDGNVNFDKILINVWDLDLKTVVSKAFKKPPDPKFIRKLEKIATTDELKKEFLKRVTISDDSALLFLKTSLKKFLKNTKKIEEVFINTKLDSQDIRSIISQIEKYKNFQIKKDVNQKLITDVRLAGEKYLVTFVSGDVKTYSIKDMAEVISNNSINNERVVLVNMPNVNFKSKLHFPKIQNFLGEISTTSGIKTELFIEQKLIVFTQSKPEDWVLINSANMSNWKIKFKGYEKSKSYLKNTQQRFNEFGLTGCLTVYNSKLDNTQFEVSAGVCEDSLNIVKSQGNINSILVNEATADAVDIDFSNIKIATLQINNAGNDCLDVSNGKYIIEKATLTFCGDKGFSVGESSTFNTSKLFLETADIGISSKDFSRVKILEASLKKTTTCTEVKQKKQEFGGAYLNINELNCNGNNVVDKNSIFVRGNT